MHLVQALPQEHLGRVEKNNVVVAFALLVFVRCETFVRLLFRQVVRHQKQVLDILDTT